MLRMATMQAPASCSFAAAACKLCPLPVPYRRQRQLLPPSHLKLRGTTCVYAVAADASSQWETDEQAPSGLNRMVVSSTLPDHVFEHNTWTLVKRCLLPLGVIIGSYGILASQPVFWLQIPLWVLIGTGYLGLYSVACSCASYSCLPDSPRLEAVIAAVVLVPLLYPASSFRQAYLNDLASVNMMTREGPGFTPVTTSAYQQMSPLQQSWTRAVLTTPLKFLITAGHVVRYFESLDLRGYEVPSRPLALLDWSIPLAVAALTWPSLIAWGGIGAWVSMWLGPWLVFHCWLSMLTLVKHTCNSSPLQQDTMDYDEGRAVLSGTCTLRLPRWLELIINDANYPRHVSLSIPFYHAREAYENLRERFGEHMAERSWSMSLMKDIVTKYQVYDAKQHEYVPIR